MTHFCKTTVLSLALGLLCFYRAYSYWHFYGYRHAIKFMPMVKQYQGPRFCIPLTIESLKACTPRNLVAQKDCLAHFHSEGRGKNRGAYEPHYYCKQHWAVDKPVGHLFYNRMWLFISYVNSKLFFNVFFYLTICHNG